MPRRPQHKPRPRNLPRLPVNIPGVCCWPRIIVVNQRLASRLLEKRGHTVVIAENGRLALEAFLAARRQRQQFDLAVMDVQMPEMDGFEATAAIRAAETEWDGHIPIVAMTAHAMTGDRERCLAAGMDGYLSKPLQPQELLRLVEELTPPPQEAAPPEAVRSASALRPLTAH